VALFAVLALATAVRPTALTNLADPPPLDGPAEPASASEPAPTPTPDPAGTAR
jgi:hypothetical protein